MIQGNTYNPYFLKAVNLVARLHEGQYRKTPGNKVPYVSHVYAVACMLDEFYPHWDNTLSLVGLLHDVLEDVDPSVYDESKMRNDFGDYITNIVKELSEDKDATMGKEEKISSWRERKEKYILKLKSKSISDEALLVCAADKIHNTYEIIESYEEYGDSIWDKFNSSKKQTVWYYNEVLQALKDQLVNCPILKELTAQVQRLSEL